MTEEIVVKDGNGARLAGGDAVIVIKDLKVKGASETIKRGTLVKNIRRTGDPGSIERSSRRVASRTEFAKPSRG